MTERPAAVRFLLRHSRVLAVFAGALMILCVFAGPEHLTAPSKNPHFTYLAEGWLHGRLHVEGKPPGYCARADQRRKKCRPAHDDWAVLYELKRKDGGVFHGYPCKTRACRKQQRGGTSFWIVPGEGLVAVERGEARKTGNETWYVSFPPGPAALMLPFVALFGFAFWDVAFTCMLGAMVPAVLVHLLDRELGARWQNLVLGAAFAFGSPFFFVAVNGSVWFTAQVTGALFMSLFLATAWRAKWPAWAGLCLAMATATRPFMLFALPFFFIEWWREGRKVRDAVAFLLPLGAVGLAVAGHNYARFSNPLEFGHHYLDIAWQPRMQEIGMFSVEYLPRNLHCLLWLMPRPADRFPFFEVSMHGVALWLGSPWLFGLLASWRRPVPQRSGLMLAALLVGIPALFYQNSGQLQYGYRFAIDWLPIVVLVLGFGLAAGDESERAPPRWTKLWFPFLVVVSVLFQAWGAWHFREKPAKLFVTDPPLWPFEDELERRQ